MRHALIAVDGELHVKDGDWKAELGTHGRDYVDLPGVARQLAGWVSGDGHRYPELYPRNVVGTVMLCCLGAAPMPYAGPVVITGWEKPPGREVVDVPEVFAEHLTCIRASIGRALAGEPMPPAHEAWAEAVREVADLARAGAAPTVTVLPLSDGRWF